MIYPARATPASFEWGTFSSTGQTTFGVYDVDNITILQTGDLAQFIWTGTDGQIDPPLPDGAPGGDDQLLDTSAVQNSGSLPPPAQNRGYITLKTYSFDTTNPQNGGIVYIRAWNASTPAGATAYGDSQTGTLTDGGVLNAPRWNTNIRLTAWSGPAGGSWNTSSNWTGGFVPDSSTYVILPGGSSTVLTGNGAASSLYLTNGATLNLDTFVLTVENGLTNLGILQQTRPVDSSCTVASPCRFLNIRNIADNASKYYAVDIATSNNLGNVVVTVKGNASACTTDPNSPPYVQRCFTITPASSGAATIWLLALISEQNGISQANLAPYRNVGGPNWQKLTNISTGNDGGKYVYARGDTTGFSSFLLGNTNNAPTAIHLTSFRANSYPQSNWLIALLLSSLAGVVILLWVRFKRRMI
jgi:hypothetical protein